jgi:hypothetical protein
MMGRSVLGRLMSVAIIVVTLQLVPAPASAHYSCSTRIYLVNQPGFGVWAQHSRQCDRPHYKYKARFWVEVRVNGEWSKIARTDDGLQEDCCNNDDPLFASHNSVCLVINGDATQTYRAYLSTTYTVSTTNNIAHKLTGLSSVTTVINAWEDC